MDFILKNWHILALTVAGAALLAVIAINFLKIKNFLIEVKQELGKVSWSTREEVAGATVVVIVITSIMTVFIGILDIFLSKGLSVLFK